MTNLNKLYKSLLATVTIIIMRNKITILMIIIMVNIIMIIIIMMIVIINIFFSKNEILQ